MTGMADFVPILTATATTCTIAGVLVGLGWWMSGQFKLVRDEIGDKLQRVEKSLDTRIDAHEKLDNERFNKMDLELLKITLREQNSGKIIGPNEI